MCKCEYCKSRFDFDDLKEDFNEVLGELEKLHLEEEEALLRDCDLYYDGMSIESLKSDEVIKLKSRIEEDGDADYLGFK